MNRSKTIGLYLRTGFICVALSCTGSAWASTGACLNPSGQWASGCSAVDGSFDGFITPVNNTFNDSSVGSNYQYNPTGTGWLFNSVGTAGGGSDDNGALIYGSEWYASAPPDGSQVAGLQQYSGSTTGASISQEVSGFNVGASYAVTFDIDERNGKCSCVTGGQSNTPSAADAIEVILGGVVLGTFTPTTDTWTQVTTGQMVATSSTMDLEFYSASTGVLSTSQVNSLFTDVMIEDPTPEPATLALVGGGLLLLAGLRRRNRSGARRTAQHPLGLA